MKPWDHRGWPAWAAALLIAVDFTGLAVARFAMGMHISGFSAGNHDDPVMVAILGPWGLLTRAVIAGLFVFGFLGRGIPPQAFGLAADTFALRARRFATTSALLAAGVFLLSATCIVVLRAISRPDLIGSPGSSSAEFIWIFVVALPPLEEVIYRGTVHGTLRRRMGPVAAILTGGLLFGALHWLYAIPLAWAWVYVLAGVALAIIYERTGSLIFPWIAHVVVNLVASQLDRWQGLFRWLRGE